MLVTKMSKNHVINLINRQSSQDFRLDRYTIRRDSINGLRIVSKDVTDDDRDTLNRLSDIAISEDKQQFSKFQQDALKAHNNYRNRHGAANLTLDNQLCKRLQSMLTILPTLTHLSTVVMLIMVRTSTGAGAVTPGG